MAAVAAAVSAAVVAAAGHLHRVGTKQCKASSKEGHSRTDTRRRPSSNAHKTHTAYTTYMAHTAHMACLPPPGTATATATMQTIAIRRRGGQQQDGLLDVRLPPLPPQVVQLEQLVHVILPRVVQVERAVRVVRVVQAACLGTARRVVCGWYCGRGTTAKGRTTRRAAW